MHTLTYICKYMNTHTLLFNVYAFDKAFSSYSLGASTYLLWTPHCKEAVTQASPPEKPDSKSWRRFWNLQGWGSRLG